MTADVFGTTCHQCGELAGVGDVFCPTCGARLAPPARSCGVCGAANQPNSRFCTACGAHLDAVEPAADHAVSPTQLVPPTAQIEYPGAGIAAPASAATGYALPSPVGLVGAVVAVVGSLLPWFDAFGVTTNAFDVAAPYLLDSQTTASDTVTVGLLVAIAAGAAAVACLVPRFAQRTAALRALGLALLAAAALFGYQIIQTADRVGVSAGDVVGIGPIVTAVGGIAVLTGR